MQNIMINISWSVVRAYIWLFIYILSSFNEILEISVVVLRFCISLNLSQVFTDTDGNQIHWYKIMNKYRVIK